MKLVAAVKLGAVLLGAGLLISSCGAGKSDSETATTSRIGGPPTTTEGTFVGDPSVAPSASVEMPSAISPESSPYLTATDCVLRATQRVLGIFNTSPRAANRSSLVNDLTVTDYQLVPPGEIASANQVSGPLISVSPGAENGSPTYYFQVSVDDGAGLTGYSLFGGVYDVDDAANDPNPIAGLISLIESGRRADLLDHLEIRGPNADGQAPRDVTTETQANELCSLADGDDVMSGFITAFEDRYS